VTCAVHAIGRNFEVLTLPHWNLRSAVVETYHAALDALGRHAAIVSQLRSKGWTVTAYTA
jgi:hypothetical protein